MTLVLTISSDRDAFVHLAEVIYDDGQSVASANRHLDREIFRDRQQLFVVHDGERSVARVAARMRDGLGMLGYFEAHDDPDAGRLLLRTAAQWLRERGAVDVVGPIDGDTWHRYRVNAGPWDSLPFLLEPINPRYYAGLWHSAGAEVAETYVSQRIEDVEPLLPRISAAAERAAGRGYRIRPIDESRLTDELTIVWTISREIFRGNAFYFDIDREEFLALYSGVDRLLDPELVLFAEDRHGAAVGFLFAYPDSDPHTVNYKTIGVLRAHRGAGVAAALQARGYESAIARGAHAANHCLIRAGNRSESMDGGHGTVFRNYYLYRMPA